jgi:hypothetical protein
MKRYKNQKMIEAVCKKCGLGCMKEAPFCILLQEKGLISVKETVEAWERIAFEPKRKRSK